MIHFSCIMYHPTRYEAGLRRQPTIHSLKSGARTTHVGDVLSALCNPHLPATLRRVSLTTNVIADLQASATKALGPTTNPAGMVSGDEHYQPASPTPKGPYYPVESIIPQPRSPEDRLKNARTGPFLELNSLTRPPRSPEQHLRNARSAGPYRFPLAQNGTLEAFNEPARTWPRRFPANPTPQLGSGGQNDPPSQPGGPGAAPQNPTVLDSIETNTTPTQATAPPATQNDPPTDILAPLPPGCVTQSNSRRRSPLSAPPLTGYQWSDPTVPGYRGVTPPEAPAPKPKRCPTAAERKAIIESLAIVAMTQGKGGLMDEFVKFLASDILDQVIVQYNTETHADNSSN